MSHNCNLVASLLRHSAAGDLQAAVDQAGRMCQTAINRFDHARRRLAEVPSWGARIDVDVDRYADGLQSWMAGFLHWSFATERYFGKKGMYIKESRVVDLGHPDRE